MNIEISAIVVTFNSQNEIQACIESLYNNTTRGIEIFVVDNRSTDATVEIVKNLQHRYKTLYLIESSVNNGLASGNNVPITRLSGKFTLVVNPDAQAMDFAIDKLYNKIIANSEIGMIGPLCLSENNKVHSSFHHNYGLLHILAWRLLPYRIIRFLYDDLFKFRFKEGKVNFVSGEFFLSPTSVLKEIRGYDERYFLSICDVADLAIKFKKAGYVNYFYPEARIYHPGGKSNNQVKILTQIKGIDGELYYLQKNKSKISAKIAKYSFLSYYMLRKFIYLVKYKFISRQKEVFVKLKVAHVLVGFLKRYDF